MNGDKLRRDILKILKNKAVAMTVEDLAEAVIYYGHSAGEDLGQRVANLVKVMDQEGYVIKETGQGISGVPYTTVELGPKGHRCLRPFWIRWWQFFSENVPIILLSTIVSAIVSYAVRKLP